MGTLILEKFKKISILEIKTIIDGFFSLKINRIVRSQRMEKIALQIYYLVGNGNNISNIAIFVKWKIIKMKNNCKVQTTVSELKI